MSADRVIEGVGETTLRVGGTDPGNSLQNTILRRLPGAEFSLLEAHLEPLSLAKYQRLQGPGDRIEYGYFINSGLASILVTTSDARSVEVGVVGREGFVGAELSVGLEMTPHCVIMQVPGAAFRVHATVLDNVLPAAPQLKLALSRFALLQGLQVAQLAACNRLHELEQRLARWLLMSHDRSGSDTLPFTHDLLAAMLGTARPSVSIAAGILQQQGAISYERGNLTIINRKLLENSACECYGVIAELANGVVTQK